MKGRSYGINARLFIILAGAVLALSACSVQNKTEERRLSMLRPSAETPAAVPMQIPLEKLKSALADDLAVDKLRVVQIFSRFAASGQELPRYRLFEIQPGSVYDILGLQNGDVLIGVNDRILVAGNLFKALVRLLPNEPTAEIEIIRGENPILLKYQFKK